MPTKSLRQLSKLGGKPRFQNALAEYIFLWRRDRRQLRDVLLIRCRLKA